MADRPKPVDILRDWSAVPDAIEAVIRDLTEADLELRGGPEGWSIRETVHHLVEANLVAAGMLIAALGSSGSTFDWSWLNPDRAWMARLGYDRAPVGPALETLRALIRHLTGLLRASPDAPRREVRLFDAPGAKTYVLTAAAVIRQEVEHAREHLGEVAATRRRHGR